MSTEDRPLPTRKSSPATLVALALALGLAGAAVAAEIADIVTIDKPMTEDVYAAGRAINVSAEIAGDLTVSGQTITVSGPVAGDVMALGETVSLSGPLADDVRAAGRAVTITGPVGDHVIVAGESVVIGQGSKIAGFAWLGGNMVQVAGEIGGDVSIGAQTALISGKINGDLRLNAASAVIDEHARIGGDLSWPQGHAPTIRDGATIVGQRIERPGDGDGEPAEGGSVVGWVIFNALALTVLTASLGAVMSPLIQGSSAIVRARPWKSLGVGLLALLGAPITAVVAMVTMIGAPIGIAVLLAFGLLLIFSVPAALSAGIDVYLARRSGNPPTAGRRFGTIALASLLFAIAAAIPIVGGLVSFVAVLLGLGALVLRLIVGERAAGT